MSFGTISSNYNDLDIEIVGYYGGFGLIINCTDEYDVCTVKCKGNSCPNLTLICQENTDGYCTKFCEKIDDDNCDYWLHIDMSEFESFDNMTYIIDNIFKQYGHYSILPNSNFTCYDNYYNYNQYIDFSNCDLCDVKRLNFEYPYNFNYSNNTNICCLGRSACQNSKIITNGNVYCNSAYACLHSIIINSNNVYGIGSSSISSSKISFDNMLFCSSYQSCYNSTIINGTFAACVGGESCGMSTFINVDIIIGLGETSLYSSTIINAKTMYLVGIYSGQYLNVSSIGNNATIFCQNNACQDIKSNIFCNDALSYGISVEICSTLSSNPTIASTIAPTTGGTPTIVPTVFPTISPSISPSISPTVKETKSSQWLDDIEKFVSFLNNATVITGISVGVVVIVAMCISKYKRDSTKAERIESILMKKEKEKEKEEDDEAKEKIIERKKIKYTLVDYIRGYGNINLRNGNHFVIGGIGLEIFYIFTDISYTLELYVNRYDISFYLFLSSLFFTIMINGIIIFYFVKKEFKHNYLFVNWFYQFNGKISILLFLCLITDASMITTIFTSQIFGHKVFYSPISLNGISILKISNIISLLFEHIPQY